MSSLRLGGDHGDMDVTQGIFQEMKSFDLVDWDVAMVCTPLSMEPALQEYDYAQHDSITRNYSLWH